MDATITFAKTATDETPVGIDLNRLLVQHPAATYFMQLAGDAEDVEWGSGDVAVIDRALEPTHNALVVAYIDGQFEIRRFLKRREQVLLGSLRTGHRSINLKEAHDVIIWGVITHLIQKVYK